MTTNFKSNGVDIDTLLIKTEEAKLVSKEKRNLSSGYWEDGIGELWVCGSNTNYELGDGTKLNRSNLIHIGSGIEWIDFDVAPTQYALGINKDGILWTWGTSGNSVPVIMDSVNKWKKVSIANIGTAITQFLIRNDNTLWSWGYNEYGQLGLGDRTDRNYASIAQVGSLADWKDVTGSYVHTLAIKTDGTLWAWGHNGNGQLGLGDTTHRSSPVQVGSLTDWAQIISSETSYATLAIKKDGTLWAWGFNSSGQLGLGDTNNRSSPVQVGSLTNWKSVTLGANSTYATKTDGTLWIIAGSGNEYNGVGGINTSSPIQLGTLNIWDSVSASNHLIAITKDGGVKFSGYNAFGQCSQNTSGSSYQYVNIQQSPVSGYENTFIKSKAKGSSTFILAY